MFKNKFFFIVFEGIEGTGKSYQANKLLKNLIKLKFNVLKTREPGGSPSAEKIRNLIFAKNSLKFDDITDYYLMLAARNEHIKSTLMTAKKNKKIVICDRFTDSTYVYQVVGKKINTDVNKANKSFILKNLKPNLTIVLKSKIHEVKKRIKNRKSNNKFDKLKNNFFIKAQNTYIKLAKNKKNYVIFDTSKNENQTEVKIFNYVLKKLR